MMKKCCLILLALALAISLTACTSVPNFMGTTGETAQSGSATQSASGNKMTSESKMNTASQEVDLGPATKEINFGETISLDFVEITIEGASSGDEIRPNNPDSVYSYKSDKEGEKYVYLYGTIKNVSGNQFEFADNMYCRFLFDDKYSYTGSVIAEEDGDFSFIYAYLDPLQSEKFYLIASVPDEMYNTYQQVQVKFGFAMYFVDNSYSEDDCSYLYSVTVVK